MINQRLKIFSRFLAILPFFLSMMVLLFTHRYLGNTSSALTLDRSGVLSLTSIVLVSFIVSLLRPRLRYYTQFGLLGIVFLLDMIEIWLALQFNMCISPNLIQLLVETNTQEVSEFIYTYVFSIKTLYVACCYGVVLVTIVLFYVIAKRFGDILIRWGEHSVVCVLWMMILIASLVYQLRMYSYYRGFISFLAADDYKAMNWIVQTHVARGGSIAYYPFSRLLYSLKSASLMGQEKELVWNTNQHLVVSSKRGQKFSPIIVLYLGESAVKRHSQHYGYSLPTNPLTMKERRANRLFVFQDAVTLKNQTSVVVRSVLSLNKSGDNFWNEFPLFPVLLQKGGYQTSFFSNQFVGENRDVWNVVGGNFLTVPRICHLLFTRRNHHAFVYDHELLSLLERDLEKDTNDSFFLFQGLGQHVAFSQRFPKEETYFTPANYAHRTELSEEEKQLVADYDNATRYVDKVMYQLMTTLMDKDAIMVYVSDHGEEVLDETHKLGRQHDLAQDVIRSEYEIPMWIWCSDIYRLNHPEVISQIQQALEKPFTIDDISHLILGLSGIQCDYYDPTRDLLSPSYNAPVKRGIGFDGFRFGGYYEDLMKISQNDAS